MLITVAFTSAVWLLVTFFTRAESEQTLLNFYTRVRPQGPGWKRVVPVALYNSTDGGAGSLTEQLMNWVLGCILIYASLFGLGYVIFGNLLSGFISLAIAIAAATLIFRNLEQTGWRSVSERVQET